MILVTGCAGFIGSHFVLDWDLEAEPLLGLDKLTYAGNLQNLAALQDNPRFLFVRGDIGDREGVAALLAKHRPRAIVNFAAESHVDRSIHGPEAFLQTNVVGTAHLLEAALAYYEGLSGAEQEAFRFLHVSTDEVYGSLGPEDPPFTEENPIRPNSPYSASKASSDAFVRAWHETFGLPTLITNCSNNYGPLQFTEKLIPLMIWNALQGKPLPVYGDGQNVRDWLYVSDHCAALRLVLEKGRVGETYNVGGHNEIKNIDIVNKICSLIDQIRPSPAPHCGLVSFVKDRLGHDRRYAIDASKIERELGWKPCETFETGIEKTVRWYLDHEDWMRDVSGGAYLDWIKTNYGAFASGEGELS